MSSRGKTRGRQIFSFANITRWRRTIRRLYEELRTAELKAEILEKELHTTRKLMEDEAADREYERACMMNRIQQLERRESLLRVVIADYLHDDNSNESESECDYDDDGDDPAVEGDIIEHASQYHTTGRERTERSLYPNCESQEWTEGRSEEVGTSSGAAATSGNNETMICDGGAASPTTVPLPASMSDGSTEGQSEMCSICLCGFDTQEVGTPEACSHSFCAECLQEWLKNTNTCPVDRQVCDTILVRRSLGGEVVRRVHVDPPRQQEEDEVTYYFVYCEVCGDSDPFNPLIFCDRCGRGYHLDCIYPRLDTVTLQTLEEWFCSDCA